MNWGQLNDPVSYQCLTGAVVALQSAAQEVQSFSNLLVANFLSLILMNSVKQFKAKLKCLKTDSLTELL